MSDKDCRLMFQQFLAYLKYVVRHKWFVFVACYRLGIPWLGIVHDLSKFSRCEFGPYARNFFGPDGRRRNVRDATGAYDPNSQRDEFRLAWLNHQRNKHHWQAWVSVGDGGNLRPLRIPHRYCLEMVADWVGAGMAISGRKDPNQWYQSNKHNMILHEDSRKEIEAILAVIGGEDE